MSQTNYYDDKLNVGLGVNLQPQGCRLTVWFLNWAMQPCVLRKGNLRRYFHKGAKLMPIVAQSY